MLKNSPRFSISQKRKEKKCDEIPGPGAYKSFIVNEGPRWGFSKTIRNKESNQVLPGPGDYEIHSTIANVPSYSKIT